MIDWIQAYGVVSIAVSGTSYFTLYRPAIDLAEEIIDKDLPSHRGVLGTGIWLVLAALMCPFTVWLLIRNDNLDFIERYALVISERYIDDE